MFAWSSGRNQHPTLLFPSVNQLPTVAPTCRGSCSPSMFGTMSNKDVGKQQHLYNIQLYMQLHVARVLYIASLEAIQKEAAVRLPTW